MVTTSAGICLANLRPFKMCTVPIAFMIVKSVLEKKIIVFSTLTSLFYTLII